MKRIKFSYLVIPVLLAVATSGVTVSADSKVESKLYFLNKLIETSSGAVKVEHSQNEEALQLREEARSLYEQAKGADKPEDFSGFIEEGTKKMFSAIRAASNKKGVSAKKTRDYELRKKSIDALLEAQQRVSTEKKLGQEGVNIKRQVDSLLSQANDYTKNGEVDGAMVMLNRAYDAIKVSLESMRSGDTLIRSFDFANKEEEYHYEIDRNDTHFMLVKVFMGDKELSESVTIKIGNYLDKAKLLRKEAEESAEEGDHVFAIDLLERSTKKVVRAIRSAGIYIPG